MSTVLVLVKHSATMDGVHLYSTTTTSHSLARTKEESYFMFNQAGNMQESLAGSGKVSTLPKRGMRVVGEKENVFKRLNYIFQISRLAAVCGGQGNLSRTYARQGKRLTERLCVRTSGDAKFGCARCGVALVLGSTATVRVRVRGRRRVTRKDRSRDARMVLRCLRCGHVKRKRLRKAPKNAIAQ